MDRPLPTRARELHWVVRGGTGRMPDGRTFPIDVDPVVLGRAEGATVAVQDPEVSALHCELRAVNDGILLRDLGSTNGTFAGVLKLSEALVTSRMEIVIGTTRVVIEPSGEARKVEVGYTDRFGPLVGRSPKMRRVFSVLERIAATPLSVLILGETGTGKELVAKAVHEASPRKGKPFVVVDCGSIPTTLAESILFGHEKGAFTGATDRR